MTTAPDSLSAQHDPQLIKRLSAEMPMPPSQMSPEHLFLRCASTVDQRPHALGWILERGRRAYPECAKRLEFTEHVRLLWHRVVHHPGYVRWVELPRPGDNNGTEKGFVLTGLGASRLQYRYQVEFVDPWYRQIMADHGADVAAQVRALLLQ